jgi:hypothetical protein
LRLCWPACQGGAHCFRKMSNRSFLFGCGRSLLNICSCSSALFRTGHKASLSFGTWMKN